MDSGTEDGRRKMRQGRFRSRGSSDFCRLTLSRGPPIDRRRLAAACRAIGRDTPACALRTPVVPVGKYGGNTVSNETRFRARPALDWGPSAIVAFGNRAPYAIGKCRDYAHHERDGLRRLGLDRGVDHILDLLAEGVLLDVLLDAHVV